MRSVFQVGEEKIHLSPYHAQSVASSDKKGGILTSTFHPIIIPVEPFYGTIVHFIKVLWLHESQGRHEISELEIFFQADAPEFFYLAQ